VSSVKVLYKCNINTRIKLQLVCYW